MNVENDVDMEVPSITWYTDHEKHSIKMKNRQQSLNNAMSKYSANAKLFNKDIVKTRILNAKGEISEEEAMSRIVGFLSKEVKSKVVKVSSQIKNESSPVLSEPMRAEITDKMKRAIVRSDEAKSAKADWKNQCNQWLIDNPYRYERYLENDNGFSSNLRSKTRDECIQEIVDHMPYSDVEEFEFEFDTYMKDRDLVHQRQDAELEEKQRLAKQKVTSLFLYGGDLKTVQDDYPVNDKNNLDYSNEKVKPGKISQSVWYYSIESGRYQHLTEFTNKVNAHYDPDINRRELFQPFEGEPNNWQQRMEMRVIDRLNERYQMEVEKLKTRHESEMISEGHQTTIENKCNEKLPKKLIEAKIHGKAEFKLTSDDKRFITNSKIEDVRNEFDKFMKKPEARDIMNNWKIMDDFSRRYDKP